MNILLLILKIDYIKKMQSIILQKNISDLFEKNEFKNINDVNKVFYSNKCNFFNIIDKRYPKEGEEFIKVFDYLKNSLVLKIDELFKEKYIPILKTGEKRENIFTRKQVALLFLLSFLDVLFVEERKNMNYFNIGYLLIKKHEVAVQFGRSFLNYLTVIGKWISENNPILEEQIIFKRNNINSMEYLYNQDTTKETKLCQLMMDTKESLFNGKASYCVDFANKYIGGGVLNCGCVQEEILFCIDPEAIVSLYFMEVMSDNDAIGIYNTIQYSNYKGYGYSFTYDGCAIDFKDDKNNKKHRIIAIDAISLRYSYNFFFSSNKTSSQDINRDIHKAYVGFSLANLDNSIEKTISTGNWGCGAFGGNHELKFIQQWIAASFAGIDRLDYYTFGDKEAVLVAKFYDKIKEKFKTAEKLYNALIMASNYGENYINNLLNYVE